MLGQPTTLTTACRGPFSSAPLKWRAQKRVIGVRGSVAVRRLANPVTLCDGHGVFFMAATRQIWMAADETAVCRHQRHQLMPLARGLRVSVSRPSSAPRNDTGSGANPAGR